ncbi:MAG: 50S ribosomal protein L18 [Salinivirgaceae bacterium]|nr:50S ribosomal protein L18 [Salinivirgaceae bacterium]
MASFKLERRNKIKASIRKNVSGTAEKPRMSVFRSNKQISVQIIDDTKGLTLASASSNVKEIADAKETKTLKAEKVGEQIAKIALEKGISQVVFDRNGFLYHGRVKALADAARKGGLKF